MGDDRAADQAWVDWFLAASTHDQLVAARAIRANSRTALRCRAEAHARYLREARQAGAIPWPEHPTFLDDVQDVHT